MIQYIDNMSSTRCIKLSLAQAKDIWSNLNPPTPFLSYEWYSSWVSLHQKEWEPYILWIDNTTLAPFVSKGNVIEFTHKFSDHLDLIGSSDVWPAILEYLKNDHIQCINLQNIPEDSDSIGFFQRLINTPMYHDRGSITVTNTSPRIALPDTFEKYLISIREKRKKYNRFQRLYPDALVTISDQPEEDVEILLEMMRKIPLKQLSSTQLKNSFIREVTKECKEDMQIAVLKIRDKVIGAQIMFVYRKFLMIWISGYERDDYPNAGTYLIMSSIKLAIEQGFKGVDLLLGSESYKYELGAKDYNMYSVMLKL